MSAVVEMPNVTGARIREQLDELISAAFYNDPTDWIIQDIMEAVDQLIDQIPRERVSLQT